MDSNDVYKVGQWLKFKAGTCFGEEKDHIGLFVAISDDYGLCLAINATSNVAGVRNFADRRHISPEETVVVIEAGTPEAAHHFSRETAFDCNRPSVVDGDELREWSSDGKVELADFNVEVNDELLERIQEGILRSPLVSEKYKKLIKRNLD